MGPCSILDQVWSSLTRFKQVILHWVINYTLGQREVGNPRITQAGLKGTHSITLLVQRGLTLLLQSWCSNGMCEARFCRERSNVLSQHAYHQAIRLTNPCSASIPDQKKGSHLSFSSMFSFFPAETIQWMKLHLQMVLAVLKQHFLSDSLYWSPLSDISHIIES